MLPMPLTPEQRAELERLTVSYVRQQLPYAGPGPGSVVPGLGNGMMLRADVAGWVAEKDEEQAQLQASTLFGPRSPPGSAWQGSSSQSSSPHSDVSTPSKTVSAGADVQRVLQVLQPSRATRNGPLLGRR